MPDTETLPADTATTDTADPEQTASGAEQAEGAEPTPAAEPSRLERLRALLDAVEPGELDEVARHPKVSGKIGSQADKLAQQRQAEAAEKAEAEARRKLRDEDPFEFAKRDREDEAARVAREAELAKLSGFASSVQGRLETYAKEHLTPDELAAAAKASDGKAFDEGLLTWVQASVDASFERRYAEKLAKELPALQKRWLAEQNGEEPSPEVSAAPPPGTLRTARNMDEANTLFLTDQISAQQFKQYRRQFGG